MYVQCVGVESEHSQIASFRFQRLAETALRVQHLEHPSVIIDHLAVVGPLRALVLLVTLTGTHPYIPPSPSSTHLVRHVCTTI